MSCAIQSNPQHVDVASNCSSDIGIAPKDVDIAFNPATGFDHGAAAKDSQIAANGFIGAQRKATSANGLFTQNAPRGDWRVAVASGLSPCAKAVPHGHGKANADGCPKHEESVDGTAIEAFS